MRYVTKQSRKTLVCMYMKGQNMIWLLSCNRCVLLVLASDSMYTLISLVARAALRSDMYLYTPLAKRLAGGTKAPMHWLADPSASLARNTCEASMPH